MIPSIDAKALGATWDEAADPEAIELARKFESAWRRSNPLRRPDPLDFLEPDDPSRTGRLLALLRVELLERRRIGEGGIIETYRDRFPEIRGDTLVALVYEDYCLGEEARENPEIDDYLVRFPEVAGRLREVLEIHQLVAEPGSTAPDLDPLAIPFPEASETIAGFHLVEELGRGSFARVFLAHERQLGDRVVALKVSRTGSREPQTLARLQHTHIVPIHSYRVDPATGLHLLCMPYFGRITLARLLADPEAKAAATGAGWLAALDRLASDETPRAVSPSRFKLARLPVARAIAWWGARMAEGLQHAHDRGVLHRDVKPSNVLIGGDGMPMLLDFNLARESGLDPDAPSKLGGTLAYMAPEHLDALGEGDDRAIDHRADIYSLGMVLFEALGVKPATGPSERTTLVDSLTWLIERRSLEAPRLDASPISIPLGLESVVRRCLAPDPIDRYASAGDLAIDLQAVADDASLHFADEPWPPRVRRWVRDHRLALAVAGPLILALVAFVGILFRAQAEAFRQESQAREWIRDGRRSSDLGQYQAASAQFGQARTLVADRSDLAGLFEEAERGARAADEAKSILERAEVFFAKAEPLRFALLGFETDRVGSASKLAEALRPFNVGGPGNWTEAPELRSLDSLRRSRLIHEVDDLLFFSVIAQAIEGRNPSPSSGNAADYCEIALRFTERPAPWQALLDVLRGPAGKRPKIPVDRLSETDASTCFRWSLLAKLSGDRNLSLAWLERATRLDPANYWHQFALAYVLEAQGKPGLAWPACDAAIALQPRSPRAWKVRARIHQDQGHWLEALEDLGRALDVSETREDQGRVRLDRGRLLQQLGDFAGASSDYEAVLGSKGEPWMAQDAGRNLAKLEADRGFDRRALARYDALLATDPGDSLSRRGRARLLLRLRRPTLATADLTRLIESPGKPEEKAADLAERAAAWLAEDRPIEALADALAAFRLVPAAASARLVDRAKLASKIDPEVWPSRPDAFDGWPDGGAALEADLRLAAARLDAKSREPGASGVEARMTRAIVLSAANQPGEALAEADRLVALDPRSAMFRRLRASILEREGSLAKASKDVAAGLATAPDDPDLLELRGMIRVRSGEVEAGLIDLKVATDRGATSAVGPAMVEALERLDRHEEALGVWSKRVAEDPLDVRGWIGLAKAHRKLGDVASGLIAIERAASLVDGGSPILRALAIEYAKFLPARPDRSSRLIDLGRKFLGAKLGRD